MNIVYFLLNIFFNEEKTNIFLMVLTSFIINLLQTNGISYINANIIDSLKNNNTIITFQFFQYFILISILYLLLYNLYKYFQNKLLTKLRQWMRHQITKMLLLVNNENFSEINFVKLNSPINRISSVSFMVFNDVVAYILPNISFLFIISIFFLFENLLLGGIFILGNIFIFLYLYLNWENMLEYNEEYEKYVNANESYLLEILNNIDKIIYRGQVNNEIDIFANKTTKSIDVALQFYSNTNYHGIIMNLILYLTLFICIGYVIYMKVQEKISITIFTTIFTIMILYRDKMSAIIQQIPDFIEFLGRSDSVLKQFKNMENDYVDIINRKYPSTDLVFKNIRFENLSFKYKTNNHYLFENLNIHLKTENKIIGITGLSGNGKSTFVKLIMKLYKPDGGKIYIDEQDIENIDANYIRKHITYVNQNSKLFDIKVVENLLYGCNDLKQCNNHLNEIMQYPKIAELYKSMDIHHKQSGSLGENLSGGQRQVANMISGFINPSNILILDEPTNALDPELKKEILGLIKDFKKYKQCIIIITHDRDVYSLFDETIHI